MATTKSAKTQAPKKMPSTPMKAQEAAVMPAPAKKREGRYYYGTGKRKTAIARVRLYIGKGELTVNGKQGNEYFFGSLIGNAMTPFKLAGIAKMFDVVAECEGGGISAQSDAVRHGISRALLEYDKTLRGTLKKADLLTRDARIKERKKYGLKRARRAPQFSKR